MRESKEWLAMHPSRNEPCPCGSGKKYKHCCLNCDQSAGLSAASTASLSTRTVTRHEMSIAAEFKHIRTYAKAGKTHIVTLDPLIFFSSKTGDAWVLVPTDHLAACLMSGRQPISVSVRESETSFLIAWQGKYTIRGQSFIFSDAEGRTTTYLDYPVQYISRARH